MVLFDAEIQGLTHLKLIHDIRVVYILVLYLIAIYYTYDNLFSFIFNGLSIKTVWDVPTYIV